MKSGKYIDETEDAVRLEIDGKVTEVSKTALRDIEIMHEPFEAGYKHLIYRSDGTLQWKEISEVLPDPVNPGKKSLKFVFGKNRDGNDIYKLYDADHIERVEFTYQKTFNDCYKQRTDGMCNPGTCLPDPKFRPFNERKYHFNDAVREAEKRATKAVFEDSAIDSKAMARARDGYRKKLSVEESKEKLRRQKAELDLQKARIEAEQKRIASREQEINSGNRLLDREQWHRNELLDNPDYRTAYERHYEHYLSKHLDDQEQVLGVRPERPAFDSHAHELAVEAAIRKLGLEAPAR
jgi:hypothetical protein